MNGEFSQVLQSGSSSFKNEAAAFGFVNKSVTVRCVWVFSTVNQVVGIMGRDSEHSGQTSGILF